MNPSKSLMAFVVAVCLLAAAPLRAAGDWTAIGAGKYVFYIPNDKLAALQPGQTTTLYRSKSATNKARSTLGKTKAGGLVVNFPGTKPSTVAAKIVEDKPVSVPAKVVTSPPPVKKENPQPKDETPARPASITNDAVWAAVANNKQVKPELREKTAQALQSFAAAHPDEFKRLSAAPGQLDAAVAEVADRVSRSQSAADIDGFLVSRAPKASAGDAPPVNGAPVKDDKGQDKTAETVINRLIELIPQDKALRQRIAARFNEYIFDPKRTGDKSYIAPALLAKDPETKIITRLKTLPGTWIEGSAQYNMKPADPGKVAYFYFIIGDNQDLPNGLTQKYAILASLKDSDLRKDKDGLPLITALENRMKVFTGEQPAQGKNPNPGEFQKGPYGEQDESGAGDTTFSDWWLDFFEKGAKFSYDIFQNAPISKLTARELVEKLNEPINAPGVGDKNPVKGGAGGGSNAKRIMAEGFNFNDLYVDGAVTGWIKIPGVDGPGRRISLKLYSAREGGQMVDRLGIFDISEPGSNTSPSNIYGRRIGLNQYGTSDIQLDDSRADSAHYKVTLKPDGTIQVKNGSGTGDYLECNMSDLYTARKTQVESGPSFGVGGKKYFMSFQGAPKGAYTYYEADSLGHAVMPADGRLRPAAMGVVSKVGDSGFVEQNTKDYIPLGNMARDKDGKQVFYFLKWNDAIGDYEYKTCDEAKKGGFKGDCVIPSDDFPKKDDSVAQSSTTATSPKGGGTGGTPGDKTTTGDDKTTTGDDKTGGGDDKKGGEGTDTGSGAYSKACDFNEGSFTNAPYKQMKMDGWTLFINKDDPSSNAFHLCINGKNTISTQGVLLSIKEEGSNLLVTVAQLDKFIPPDDVIKGSVNGGEYKRDGKVIAGVSMRFVHYISLADAAPAALKALGKASSSISMDKAAWLTFVVDPKSNEGTGMQVHLREIDAAKAVELTNKGFGFGTASRSAFNNAADKPKIIDFVKKEVERYKGATLVMSNMSVFISLDVQKETVSTVKEPSTLVSIVTAATQDGTNSKGEPILKQKCHDSLKYCTYPNSKDGDKPFGIETLTAHRAHMGLPGDVCGGN